MARMIASALVLALLTLGLGGCQSDTADSTKPNVVQQAIPTQELKWILRSDFVKGDDGGKNFFEGE